MTITGDWLARWFPYVYRVPVPTEIHSMLDLDPARVYADHEYPRWSDPIRAPEHKVEYRCEVGFVVTPIENNWSRVDLVLMPNKYTGLKENKVVVTMYAADDFLAVPDNAAMVEIDLLRKLRDNT